MHGRTGGATTWFLYPPPRHKRGLVRRRDLRRLVLPGIQGLTHSNLAPRLYKACEIQADTRAYHPRLPLRSPLLIFLLVPFHHQNARGCIDKHLRRPFNTEPIIQSHSTDSSDAYCFRLLRKHHDRCRWSQASRGGYSQLIIGSLLNVLCIN